jgi:transposase
MLNLTSAALKVFLALDTCDMRKTFIGLHSLASDQLQTSPARDALFVFTNKRRNDSTA